MAHFSPTWASRAGYLTILDLNIDTITADSFNSLLKCSLLPVSIAVRPWLTNLVWNLVRKLVWHDSVQGSRLTSVQGLTKGCVFNAV